MEKILDIKKILVVCLLCQVLQAAGWKDISNYHLQTHIGSRFLDSKNLINYGVALEFSQSIKNTGGINLTYFSDQELSLLMYYKYSYSQLLNVRAGFDVNFLLSDREMTERFIFPKDNDNYLLDDGLYTSFFVRPELVLSAGRLKINQGVMVRFLLTVGEVQGIAYNFNPFVNISFVIF